MGWGVLSPAGLASMGAIRDEALRYIQQTEHRWPADFEAALHRTIEAAIAAYERRTGQRVTNPTELLSVVYSVMLAVDIMRVVHHGR